MRATSLLRAPYHRQPLIKFLGKRTFPPPSPPSPPAPHPASPTPHLPSSFAAYRSKAQQHGPLNQPPSSSSKAYGAIGGHAGSSLGPVEPKKGEFFDRSELPRRFQRMTWTQAEIEAVETGGASVW